MKFQIAIASLLFTSCAYIPKMATSLNDSKELKDAQFESNGVFAFVPHYAMNQDAKIQIDFMNIDSNKTYRITMTPGLKTRSTTSILGKVVHEGEIQRSEVSDTVALYLLPAGKYESKYSYAYFGNKKSVKGGVSGGNFEIHKNEITSVGNILIPFEAGLFKATIPTFKTIDTNTTALIKNIETPISKMKVNQLSIELKADR